MLWVSLRGRVGGAEAATAGLALVASGFFILGEDTEAAMFGLAFGGLLVARALGVPRSTLLPLAVVIAALVAAVLLTHGPVASILAHVVLGGVLAWVLAGPVFSRLPAGRRPGAWQAMAALVAIVLALGVAWEVGEVILDDLIGTALTVGLGDTLADLGADALGGLAGALVAARYGGQAGVLLPQGSRGD